MTTAGPARPETGAGGGHTPRARVERASIKRARIKTGKASLIGGIAVAVAAFALWVAISRELGAEGIVWLAAGAVVSVAVGAWIRIADL